MINDKRLGRITEDGNIQWPVTTISGVAPYRKPSTNVYFSDGHFAVLDIFISPDKANELIVELTALFPAPVVSSDTTPLDELEDSKE